MKFDRKLTKATKPVEDQIQWKTVDVQITGTDFKMSQVEVPAQWSQTAANILAQKYFRKAGVPQATTRTSHYEIGNEKQPPGWLLPSIPQVLQDPSAATTHETSAKQVFHRMCGHWTYTGWKEGYFQSEQSAQAFYDEMYYVLAMQLGAPNSPQWFNTGLWWAYGIEGADAGLWVCQDGEPDQINNSYQYPQVSACFINSIKDSLVEKGGIFDLLEREARIFKFGSGAGSNFSSLRGKTESLSGGGRSSGLMSFLEIFDRAAGAIQSGGTTRRAAKMVVLDADHPEIEEFIGWKTREENKAKILAKGLGETDLWEGEAIRTVLAQNANNSIRFKDEFFDALDNNETVWALKNRTDEKIAKIVRPQDLWSSVCRAAWACGDPGLQFHNTINRWNTCAADGEINATNPCGEYIFLDDTACNLASLNLVNCLRIYKNTFQSDSFRILDVSHLKHVARLLTVVLDISVSMASYPDREIALNSWKYRTLGLGYANLGGLLMQLGLPYDSDEGRELAGYITAIMHGMAYLTSVDLADGLGKFPQFQNNAKNFRQVMHEHYSQIGPPRFDSNKPLYEEAARLGSFMTDKPIFRNAQVTLIAPTGTISFVMDCGDFTGVEPAFALKSSKALAGGGTMEIINESVQKGLLYLGYKVHEINLIMAYARQHGTLEGCKDLRPEHLPIFDCANTPEGFSRTISPEAHIKMVAAVQPFLSGGVSKTVNLPNSATVEDIDRTYRLAHKLGLKSISLYREGSKMTQPLRALGASAPEGTVIHIDSLLEESKKERSPIALDRSDRERLPERCAGYRQKFRINDHPVYLHTGEYPDRRLGEIFIEMSDEGSTLRAMANALAKAVSLGIQFGVPLEEYVEAFINARFEPSGQVQGHKDIKICSSVLSAVFRDLGINYLGRTDLSNTRPRAQAQMQSQEYNETHLEEVATVAPEVFRSLGAAVAPRQSGQFCSCGTLMIQTGTCLTCPNCFNQTGGCS